MRECARLGEGAVLFRHDQGSPASDEVETRLLAILDMVNDWLKFAEAKSLALIALSGSGATGLALITYQTVKADTRITLIVGLLATEACLVLSLAVALLSLFPQTNLAKFLTRDTERPVASDNLYYFGHLRKYTPALLAAAVAQRYAKDTHYDADAHCSHTDLAAQLIANSRITAAKLQLFSLAAILLAAAVAVLVAALLLTGLLRALG